MEKNRNKRSKAEKPYTPIYELYVILGILEVIFCSRFFGIMSLITMYKAAGSFDTNMGNYLYEMTATKTIYSYYLWE